MVSLLISELFRVLSSLIVLLIVRLIHIHHHFFIVGSSYGNYIAACLLSLAVTFSKSKILRLGIFEITNKRYLGSSVTRLLVRTNLCSLLHFESFATYESSLILLFIKKRFSMIGKDSEMSAIVLMRLLVTMREVSRSKNEKLASFLISLSLRSMH